MELDWIDLNWKFSTSLDVLQQNDDKRSSEKSVLLLTIKNSTRFMNKWDDQLVVSIEHLWSIGFSFDANHISNLFDLCQIRLKNYQINFSSFMQFLVWANSIFFFFIWNQENKMIFKELDDWLFSVTSDWITLILWATTTSSGCVEREQKEQEMKHNHL